MAVLHKHSHGTPLPEFDLFTVPPTQISVDRDIETEHRPNFPIKEGVRELVFEFSTPDFEYVSMRETEFSLNLRFKTASANWTFKPELNFLDTLIESVDIWINDKLVTHSTSTYPWRASIYKFLNTSSEAQSGHLTTTIADPDGVLWKPSDTSSKEGPWFELRGKLYTDLTLQNRAILGGCKYKIIVRLNKRESLFQYITAITSAAKTGQTSQPTVQLPMDVEYEINEASLLVHRSLVTPLTLSAHRSALAKATAKYPINRVEIKTITITPNINDIKTESIFTGQLPRRVCVLFVPTEATLGDLKSSLYTFGHFNLNYLAFDIDGVEFPRNGFTPDFEKKRYMREYYTFMQSFNQDTSDATLPLSYPRWASSPVFAYNFAPDLSGGCDFGHINTVKQGSLGMRIRFLRAPIQPITAFIHAEFDNLIEIDKAGTVTTDYM